IIAEIENELAAAETQSDWNVAPPSQRDERIAASLDDGRVRGPEADFVPSVSRDERLAPGAKPADARHDAEALLQGGRRERSKRKRRNPWIRLILWLVVLGLLVLGGWWIWGQVTEAVRTRGASIEDIISTNGSGEALLPSGEDSEWIEIFTPSDASTVRANNGAAAEISRDDEGNFLSIGGQG